MTKLDYEFWITNSEHRRDLEKNGDSCLQSGFENKGILMFME